ncbi:MAG TPA: hypothetical protein V6D14_07860 [Coleofasciculaceae cyanobacterium]|jgi:hypothetical protein
MFKNKKKCFFSLLIGTSGLLSLGGAILTPTPAISLSSGANTSTPWRLNSTTLLTAPQGWVTSQIIPGTNTRRCNQPKWNQYRTFLYYCSQPGDYIGGGQQRTLTPVDGDFIPSGSSTGGVVTIRFNGGLDWWSADFIAPRGAKLEKGTYKGAQRYPFQSPTKPGFNFSGSGRGCNRLSAQFTIYQIVYDTDGKIKLFEASFTQRCEETMPPLYGWIRYNRADAPPNP